MAYRHWSRIAADEHCLAIQVSRHIVTPGGTCIAKFLGLDNRDEKWIGPDGRDLTALCNRSLIGGFYSRNWTIDGWVLSDRWMAELRAEFPNEFAHR